MKIEDIRPNSVEAVAFFVLYICAQDKVISDEERNTLIKFSKYEIINNLKDYQYKKEGLEKIILRISDLIIKSKFLHKYTSKEEKALVNHLINDVDVIKVALRISRVAATADEFSDREKIKFKYWIDNWKGTILDGD